MQKSYDVAIVGAGAAGLITALAIAQSGKSVAVIEAGNRCGGRMLTITGSSGMPLELGAEFVHGQLSVTLNLLKKAGIKTYTTGGDFWRADEHGLQKQNAQVQHSSGLLKRMKDLKQDVSLKDFVDTELHDFNEEDKQSLLRYAKGYYAADPVRLSTCTMYEEMTKHDDEQFRPEGGYVGLVNYLEEQCREHGVTFFLSAPVKTIDWKAGSVEVKTTSAVYTARKVLVTVSLGVLQSGKLCFSPALPRKMEAAGKLGFGHVQKLVYHFAEPFWKLNAFTRGEQMHNAGFIFSGEAIPTWWTRHPLKDAVLTGWLGGPEAKALADRSTDELIANGLQSLANIFHLPLENLRRILLSAHHYNWSGDERFCGAYSYTAVGAGQHITELLQPVEETVFFAGEGLYMGKDFGTVEAALQVGRDVAHRLIAGFPSS